MEMRMGAGVKLGRDEVLRQPAWIIAAMIPAGPLTKRRRYGRSKSRHASSTPEVRASADAVEAARQREHSPACAVSEAIKREIGSSAHTRSAQIADAACAQALMQGGDAGWAFWRGESVAGWPAEFRRGLSTHSAAPPMVRRQCHPTLAAAVPSAAALLTAVNIAVNSSLQPRRPSRRLTWTRRARALAICPAAATRAEAAPQKGVESSRWPNGNA